MQSLSELLSFKTLDDWKASLISAAQSVGLATENWAEGGYTRSLVALFSQLYKTAGDVVRIIAAGGFLDKAEGAWLTLLAKQVFNVDRVAATFAKAPLAITLTNNGGGLYIYAPRDIVFAHATTKKTYRNTSGGTLNPGVGQTLALDLEAEEAGAGSSAGIGSITEMVTTSLGVTCTNTMALVGIDEEKDPALRQRCRDSLAALALGGIKKAYEYIAKSAKRPDGTPIGITRVRVMPAPGDGTVTVYVADASGTVSAPDVAIVQALFDTLVSPYGFSATVFSTTTFNAVVPSTIWIPAALGLSEAEARQLVFDALAAYVLVFPIGGVVIPPAAGFIYWRALLGVVEAAIPGTLKATLVYEIDFAVGVNQAAIWAGVLSDTTVVQVA